MNTEATTPPELEERFLPPQNWRWHYFKNPDGKKIRFGSCAPEGNVPDAVVIVLQGLSEYIEKYFELASSLQKNNYSFWMIDWRGQGKSDRHLTDRQKRHSDSFEDDVEDLDFFIDQYVKHSAVHPEVGRIPLVLLGHSAGGNIGLRYISKYPDVFEAAAFSAPMFDLKAIKNKPKWLINLASGGLNNVMRHNYFPNGQGAWTAEMREKPENDIFSNDPVRKEVHNAWLKVDPELQVGNATVGWVHQAMKSCKIIQNKLPLEDIKIPCLFGKAEHEDLVDNEAIDNIAKRIPNSQVLELKGAKHEIVMETDEIRNSFLNAFDKMLKDNNIKDKLKRF